ncbi:MAG: aminotransferase class V-fold PLP-dependent enzyme [Pseudomonadota bacterium]
MLACGSALMPRPVIDAITDHIALEARIGGYEAHAVMGDQLDAVYDVVGELVGAASDEIALLENATVAWCHAFYALPLQAGDRVVTCEAEYAANYVAFLQRRKRDGIEIDIAPSDETGAVDLSALEALIGPRTRLIAMTWIPTNGGLVNPAAEVGAIAQRHKVPFLLDACQAVGQIPIDVEAIGCDFLSATARKFLRGPRGMGFLYVRRDWIARLEPVTIDHFAAPWVERDGYELRTDARRFETWENAYALRAGLGCAARYALDLGLDAIRARAWGLADRLRANLANTPGVRVRDAGSVNCAIVSFEAEGREPAPIVRSLRERGIAIGTSSASSTRIDAERRSLPTLLRTAPHVYNTASEIDRLTETLETVLRETD